MASIDNTRCIPENSGSFNRVSCGPCKTAKIENQANHYCKECVEYLCDSCKDFHTKMMVTDSHTIVSNNEIPVPSSERQRSSFVAYCGCYKKQEVEFFCEEHHDVVCSLCKKETHQNCKLAKIQEKSADYTISQSNAVLSKIKELAYRVGTSLEQDKSNSKALRCLNEEHRKEIKEIRAKINDYLDTLEQDAVKDFDEYNEKQQQHIEKRMSTLITASQVLALDSQKLEDTKTDGNRSTMFTADVKVSKHISEYETMLSDFTKNEFKPAISFEGIKRLTDIQKYISFLGNTKEADTNLNVSPKSENTLKFSRKVLLGTNARLKCRANVKLRDDKHRPSISGCTFMPDGSVMLCDNANDKLKYLDTDLVLNGSIKLSSSPWDVSAIDDTKVIITLPRIQQLQYIQIFPELTAGRKVHLDKPARGVETSGNEIYTTYIDKKGEGGVIVLDLNGIIKKQICVNREKPFICRFPFYITVSQSGKIFVSYGSVDTGTVACMSADGNIFYQYKNKEFKNARGMCVDGGDNIFVCDKVSNNIQIITSEGKHHGTLVSTSVGLKQPYSMAFRASDDTLLVGCSDQECVFIFKL